MRALRIIDNEPTLIDVEEPSGDGVLMEVVASSICGTDLGLAGAGLGGVTLGHEFAGLVDGVPYAVEPTLWCGACGECGAGHTQRCTDGSSNMGIFADGGLADLVLVPDANLVPLPAGLDVADACLVEPMAVAWHGVRRADVQTGERVVVVGGGSIGLLAVAALRHHGVEVDLEARHPHQQAAGERLGAGSPSGVYDVVIEAAGSDSAISRCAALARPGARVMLLGLYHGVIPAPGTITLVKELSWIGAMAYERHDGIREVDEAAAMLAANADIAPTLITHRLPLDRAAEAFRLAGDRASGAIKVVLEP